MSRGDFLIITEKRKKIPNILTVYVPPTSNVLTVNGQSLVRELLQMKRDAGVN